MRAAASSLPWRMGVGKHGSPECGRARRDDEAPGWTERGGDYSDFPWRFTWADVLKSNEDALRSDPPEYLLQGIVEFGFRSSLKFDGAPV
ncbi:hypothetical protein Sinac_6892 [Singulisphaera acidiphila DSM 18658]|uniref:Uncharacterized protein n=1 Tax=Singulisphaera acidiphila (strain ATCC BAA-1392 / DSM 18658 / VKM B-2454 / MOB10) TaxID=886293 RepID=L0DNX4_SINAD|nr:hypothetical protein Sinac_6892 [Singulisphaera acidiphila DSM 18658]